ncbi:LysR family transcriptional regulator [Pelagibius sp. Alg239-R121]|uniref:LysR family transcriptional regulator n=1 Tax=Pelagibius sp. Alg239-R121 TaxID=2993448 RepID=UPI0024A679C2|nr:LysR family transcriptional regulator [Pelagibius sp. Alg239-R121]
MTKDAISKISLRQLQIFLSAIEHQNFIRAAEHLDLTPPAISMQMSRLSEALGAPLFEKDGRSIQPTAAATALVPYAERVIATLREANDVIEDLQGTLDSLVRVAMVSTSRNFGPQLLQKFKQLYPEAKLEISITNRRGVIGQLETGQADLAIMGRTPRRFEVEAFSFAKHPYVLISHPDHPLTGFKRILRSDLTGHRFLVREAGSGTRMVHDHFFKSAGLTPPRTQEMDSNANIKQAVMANMGLAFISAHTIALERETAKLKVLDVSGMPEVRNWYVLHLRGKKLSPAALNFRRFVEEEGPGFMRAFFGEDLSP